MNLFQRIGKNIGVYFIGQIGSGILYFLFFIYAARYLGSRHFGVLSFSLALVSIFGIFCDLGLRQVITRDVARNRDLAKKYISNILGVKIVLSIIAITALILFVNLLHYPGQTKQIAYLLCLFIVFNSFLRMFYGLFQAYERMEFESLGMILLGLLILLDILFVRANNLSILVLAFFYSLSGAITLGYAFIISSRKFVVPKLKLDWHLSKYILKEALPFGLIGVFGVFLHWIDTVMLSVMQGDVVVGWYNVAYRFFFALLFIPAAFNAAIFPVMSRFYLSSKNSLLSACEKSFKYLTFIALPIAVGITLLAGKAILLFYGSEYHSSIIALQVLIWSAVIIFMGTPFSNVFSSTD